MHLSRLSAIITIALFHHGCVVTGFILYELVHYFYVIEDTWPLVFLTVCVLYLSIATLGYVFMARHVLLACRREDNQ